MREEYSKDFEGWNKIKQALQRRTLPEYFFVLEREIWWASLGINIGREEDGKNNNYERPVLVLKVIDCENLWILPITSKENSGQYFHTTKVRQENKTILLQQIRFISAKRLSHLAGRMNQAEFCIIKEKIIGLLQKQEIPS